MNTLPYKSQLKEFLTLSLDRCMKAVDALSGSIFLLDDDKNELVLEVAKHHKEVALEGIRERLGERISGKVALERKPYLVEDIDNEPSLGTTQKYDHYESKSFLSVPLEFYEEIIGVVNLTEKSNGLSFSDKDLLVVMTISRYLGIALYSLRKYLEKQQLQYDVLAEEIQHLKKSIEQSQKYTSLGKLVGGLVHEINNPLDGVMRYVNLAFDSLQEETVGKEYLGEAKMGLSRIARVIRSLLDFSWSLSPQEGKVEINRALEESLYMLNHLVVAYNIEVKKFFEPHLPKIPDYRLKLVFNNIIKNACEEMKQGGVLSIYTVTTNNMIEVRIKDTGRGIPLELQDKIFDPFFTTKNMGEGSGLGLAISYEIVQRYQGNIFVESTSGEGATFIIQIPMNVQDI